MEITSIILILIVGLSAIGTLIGLILGDLNKWESF